MFVSKSNVRGAPMLVDDGLVAHGVGSRRVERRSSFVKIMSKGVG